jgi:AAA family ATP:ADP antiporter
LLLQVLIFSCGSLAASTPFLAAALVAIITAWIFAARSLSTQFNEKMAAQVAE